MRDGLLMAMVAAMMGFGWLLMGRLDSFFAANTDAAACDPCTETAVLRIGVSDPMIAGGLSGVLEQVSKAHPRMRVSVYAGDGERVAQRLWEGELEAAFLPPGLWEHPSGGYGRAEVLLRPDSVAAGESGLPVSPLTAAAAGLTLVWKKESRLADEFAAQMTSEMQIPGGSAEKTVLS